jgi:hypothetical protein
MYNMCVRDIDFASFTISIFHFRIYLMVGKWKATKNPHCLNNSKMKYQNRKRSKIDISNTHIIHDHSPSWLGTGTSIKSGEIKLVLRYQVSLLRSAFHKWIWGYVFFLKKYSDSQCCWKKYSDFGGGTILLLFRFWYFIFELFRQCGFFVAFHFPTIKWIVSPL